MAEKKFNKYVVEAARAAVLATHTAAGLATGGGAPREVARLLRSAEALSRSAVALLSTSTARSSSSGGAKGAFGARGTTPDVAFGARVGSPDGAGNGTSGTGKRGARRRGRRSKQVKNNMQVDSGPGVAPVVPSGSAEASARRACGKSPSERDVGVQRCARVLVRHETLPSSLVSSSTSASLVDPVHIPPPGTLGSLFGLSARPELNGAEVRFLRFDKEADRFIVELSGRSPPPIRVKRECFRRRAIDEDGEVLRFQ